jgi:DNA-binding response OmpR family regulator
MARVRALLRRGGNSVQFNKNPKAANLELDIQQLTMTTDFGTQKLYLKEAQLLDLLIRQGKIVSSKDLIIEKLWEYESEAEYSHVEYHVSTLRKKMKAIKADVTIKTIRGVGYVLNEG